MLSHAANYPSIPLYRYRTEPERTYSRYSLFGDVTTGGAAAEQIVRCVTDVNLHRLQPVKHAEVDVCSVTVPLMSL